jgi:hypothetical protein
VMAADALNYGRGTGNVRMANQPGGFPGGSS